MRVEVEVRRGVRMGVRVGVEVGLIWDQALVLNQTVAAGVDLIAVMTATEMSILVRENEG